MIASLLSRVSSADIVTEPFPHVCIPDALPADLYAQLAAHYPGFDRIGWAGDRAPASNHRFQLSAWPAGNMPDMAPVWRNFLAYHASSAFFAQVVALFADHWPAALIERCGGSLLDCRPSRRSSPRADRLPISAFQLFSRDFSFLLSQFLLLPRSPLYPCVCDRKRPSPSNGLPNGCGWERGPT